MNKTKHAGRLTDSQVRVALILPGLAVFAAIIPYPFVDAILMSFTDRSMLYPDYQWVQLENYSKVFRDPYFGKTLLTTALFVLGSTVLPYVLGLIWAILLDQGFRGAEFLRGVTLVNWIIPGTAIGFVWSWNDLLYSMTLVTDTSRRTLASGLVMTFLGEASTNWGYMMAASIVSAIPVTIIFVFLQRYFIQGLTAGAVKG